MGTPAPSTARAARIALQRGRVVQRRQVGERLDGLHHLVVDERRLGEAVAAVDDPVADGVQGAQQAYRFQPVEHASRGLIVVGHGGGLLEGFAALDRELEGRLPADAIHDAAGQPPLLAGAAVAVGLDELELQRRAAAVDDENLHHSRKGTSYCT